MAFYFNGSLIPENVAGAFKYNGADVTQVVFNGTTVWEQSLFSATWSGNSIILDATYGNYGLETSGSLIRATGGAAGGAGAWITANIDGTFSNAISLSENWANYNIYMLSAGGQYGTAANQLKFSICAVPSSAVSFTIGTGFTGGLVLDNCQFGLETSGGLLRVRNYAAGNWISLT